jgi:hypothetical protein
VGQLIRDISPAHNLEIDVHFLKPGTYYLVAETEKGLLRKRFMKL